MLPIPILPLVDPHGILKKFTKDGFSFFHSKEMKCIIIKYIKWIQALAKGKNKAIGNIYMNSDIAHMPLQRVEAVNPQIFRIGDIIEAQVSFIVVPLKDNKYKMIVINCTIGHIFYSGENAHQSKEIYTSKP